jgi:hypothetical protein
MRYDMHGRAELDQSKSTPSAIENDDSSPPAPAEATLGKETADKSLFCGICRDTVESERDMFALPCRHWFCKDCFSGHITSKVGASEWKVGCPHGSSCTYIVPIDAAEFLCAPDTYKKMRGNMLTSFIEDKQGKTRALYCKNPRGCDGILLLADDSDHAKVSALFTTVVNVRAYHLIDL